MEVETALDLAKELEGANNEKAIAAYRALIFNDDEDEEALKFKEQAILALGNLYANLKRAQELNKLTRDIRQYFVHYPKAKTAKIVRTLIDMIARTGESAIQVTLCQETIEWCNQEKRTFLRHRVETRLAGLYLTLEKYELALSVLTQLLREAKKMDDKLLLVEIHLIECKTHFRLENIARSKAALTAAKTSANAIHCPPLQQAEIDSWSGILALREKDYKTAYSYFYESFEAFHSGEDKRALSSFKYLILTKIMDGDSHGVTQAVSSKSGLKYATETEVLALLDIAKALKARSLKIFEDAIEKHKAMLNDDVVIRFHVADVNDALVEQNLLRILEPYSVADLDHVAKTIELPRERTTQKLSEMILDQKLHGTLDQGNGVIILFSERKVRPMYESILEVIKNSSQVLDCLSESASKLV
eukprot:GEMP01008641.1.p1 GENE.GEMP01008641.1~~GEMP01008641.1.p1  ORF type:complete len:418 (+),score=89.28 GEMP01008641.1:30-1283(+)